MNRSASPRRRGVVAILAIVGAILALPSTAAAADQAIAWIPSDAGDIAVNSTGAGPADPGDIYVAGVNRVQRYAQNDNGTPANPYDDSYAFVSAWGAGVETGGDAYEICTVEASCQQGQPSSGNGGLRYAEQIAVLTIAVDQDTGNVYVGDAAADGNNRVNVYSGDGVFLRSFGFDVVASGPGDAGTGFEICVAANGDVCKSGVAGPEPGQLGFSSGIAVSLPDGDSETGTVFVSNPSNSRVETYALDGSPTGRFGSAAEFGTTGPMHLAIDSRGIVYAEATSAGDPASQQVARYDSLDANGGGIRFLAPIEVGFNEIQALTVSAGAGQFKLSFGAATTADIPFDAPAATIDSALESLPSIGPSNVEVRGGPGRPQDPFPYEIEFVGTLARQDVQQLVVSPGSTPLSGGSGAAVQTTAPGEAGPLATSGGQQTNAGLEVDPDSDGAGPDTDVLYALRGLSLPVSPPTGLVQQFGPNNPPGLIAPPNAVDDEHGTAIGFGFLGNGGLGLDVADGQLFVGTRFNPAFGEGPGTYALGPAGGPASATLDSVGDITASSAVLHGVVDPNGPPPVSYRVEYSEDGSTWKSTAAVLVGTQESPQTIDALLQPPGIGLEPSTEYHVRLVASKAFTPPSVSATLTFTTLASSPVVETVGSPVRGATSAALQGRVNPRGAATTYRFEYGTAGPCSSNSCQSTDLLAAGDADEIRLVSQQLDGLSPNTTYHYRLVADNGVGGSPVFGEDMTVTTRASDQLTPPAFPGPEGSDRAWEQVSLTDSGSNPIPGGMAFSDDGERVVYQNAGGSPSSDSGSFFSMLFAERTDAGWRTTQLAPSRDQVIGPNWLPTAGNDDLSDLFTLNFDPTTNESGLWRLQPGSSPTLLHRADPGQYKGFFAASDDGSRKLALLSGGLDDAHPAPPGSSQLYDVTSGTPHLVSLLPGNVAPSCGVATSGGGTAALPDNAARRPTRWLSPDGSLLLFPSRGNACNVNDRSNLYLRNLETEVTVGISTSPLAGPLCEARPLKQTPGAVFFITASKLSAEDVAAEECAEGTYRDVYRYGVEAESLDCVTCQPAGLSAEAGEAAVAPDGSRVYFKSTQRLLPGVVVPALYRVEVGSGELAYVGPIGDGQVGGSVEAGGAISPDGSVLIFMSDSPGLDAVNGPQNGGTAQYYRYDDDDRSLVCVSCPQDGSAPAEAVNETLAAKSFTPEVGPNADPLDDAGDTFIFATANPLVDADQNTAEVGQDPSKGQDLYEWRDGRILLVSDGLTNWPNAGVAPTPNGISADGRDVFFTASTQYTPDAIDSYQRLYDARIGGGFEFPPPPKPCPLEVCQGTPKGAPEKTPPGTRGLTAPGNPSASERRGRRGCSKGKRKVRRKGKVRCAKPRKHAGKQKQRANQDRRNHR